MLRIDEAKRVSFWKLFRFVGTRVPLGTDFLATDDRIKFIVCEGVLIWGDIDDHTLLHVIATLGETDKLITWLRERSSDAFDEWREQHDLYRKVTAAGYAQSNGRVTDWESHGLRVVTPDAIRQPIEELLKRVVAESRNPQKPVARGA